MATLQEVVRTQEAAAPPIVDPIRLQKRYGEALAVACIMSTRQPPASLSAEDRAAGLHAIPVFQFPESAQQRSPAWPSAPVVAGGRWVACRP